VRFLGPSFALRSRLGHDALGTPDGRTGWLRSARPPCPPHSTRPDCSGGCRRSALRKGAVGGRSGRQVLRWAWLGPVRHRRTIAHIDRSQDMHPVGVIWGGRNTTPGACGFTGEDDVLWTSKLSHVSGAGASRPRDGHLDAASRCLSQGWNTSSSWLVPGKVSSSDGTVVIRRDRLRLEYLPRVRTSQSGDHAPLAGFNGPPSDRPRPSAALGERISGGEAFLGT